MNIKKIMKLMTLNSYERSITTILLFRYLEEYGELSYSDIIYFLQKQPKKTLEYHLKHRYIKLRHGKYSLTRKGKKLLAKLREYYKELLWGEMDG